MAANGSTQRWLSRAGTVVASGLSGGLVGGLTFALILALIYGSSFAGTIGRLVVGGLFGLLLGLIIGLVGAFMELRPAEKVRLGLAGLTSRLRRAAGVGLVIGLSFGLSFGLSLGLIAFLASAFHGQQVGVLELSGAVIGGLKLALSVGLIVGLITLVSGEAVETRRSPNQGTRDSIKIALAALPGGGLIGWLFFVLAGGLKVGRMRVVIGMGFGLNFALIFGLFGGGLFALRHFVLRLVLWIKRSEPLNYVCFLNQAVNRLFLRKVGGGYIFVHRMPQEHFASLAEPHPPGIKDAVKLLK